MNKWEMNWFFSSYEALQKELNKDKYANELLYTILPVVEKSYRQSEKMNKKDTFRLLLKILFTIPFFKIDVKLEKSDLIIWPVQFVHLDYIIPVYFQLVKLGISSKFVSEKNELIRVLNANGIDCIKLNYTLKYGMRRANLIRLRSILHIFFKAGKYRMAGGNFSNSLLIACNYFATYEAYSSVSQKLLKAVNPTYNLLGYELSVVCRPVQLESNKQKIRTGRIQQGALNYSLLNYSNVGELFVWDSIALNACLKRNKHAVLIGPACSKEIGGFGIASELKEIKAEADKRKQTICLVAFSGAGYFVSLKAHEYNIEILTEIVRERPEIQFIIKLHPKDRQYFYNQMIDCENVIFHKKDGQHTGDLREFIGIANFMLTGASTAAIEMWQQGKVVISVDVFGELESLDFIQSGMAYNCKNKTELKEAFKSVITRDPNLMRKLANILEYKQEYAKLLLTEPAKKIAEHISSYIAECKTNKLG